ncbi:MAG: OprO/OprP family phosphate-selective porin, partial [Limisphaerales bacterium]
LDFLQSAKNWSFDELSLASDLVPDRDLGVELHGDLFGGTISYAAGIFNGVADSANTANSDFDNDKEFAGRLFFQPLKTSGIEALQGLGFGVSGTYGDESGATAVSKYKTDGQQSLFTYRSAVVGDGTHWRISPQGYYYYGPFGVLAEYVESSQKVASGANEATLNNNAWDVTVSWILTGEKNQYNNNVTPDNPFNPAKGHWGAWGLFARYAQLDIDSDAFPIFADPTTSAKSADAWSVGLSWWLNKNIRVNTDFSRTTFSGGASGAVTKEPEEVFFTRIQLAF